MLYSSSHYLGISLSSFSFNSSVFTQLFFLSRSQFLLFLSPYYLSLITTEHLNTMLFLPWGYILLMESTHLTGSYVSSTGDKVQALADAISWRVREPRVSHCAWLPFFVALSSTIMPIKILFISLLLYILFDNFSPSSFICLTFKVWRNKNKRKILVEGMVTRDCFNLKHIPMLAVVKSWC